MSEEARTEQHGYGVTSDCLCGRNFDTVRGLREHLTKKRTNRDKTEAAVRPFDKADE